MSSIRSIHSSSSNASIQQTHNENPLITTRIPHIFSRCYEILCTYKWVVGCFCVSICIFTLPVALLVTAIAFGVLQIYWASTAQDEDLQGELANDSERSTTLSTISERPESDFAQPISEEESEVEEFFDDGEAERMYNASINNIDIACENSSGEESPEESHEDSEGDFEESFSRLAARGSSRTAKDGLDDLITKIHFRRT